MPRIERVVRFKVFNKEHDNINKLKQEMENMLGRWIDDYNKSVNPTQAIPYKGTVEFFEYVTKKENRQRLVDLLTTTIDVEDPQDKPFSDHKTYNIWDY